MTNAYSNGDNERATWTEEDRSKTAGESKTEWRRKRHSIKMVEFRAKKKEGTPTAAKRAPLPRTPVKPKDGILVRGRGPSTSFANERQVEGSDARCRIAAQDEDKALRRYPALPKPILPVEGWWVRFPDGAPPFFFAPLAPEEIAAEANPLGPEFVPDLSAASMVGTLVGWNLYRELSPRGATGGLQRMRLTKRLNCSINTGLWVAKEYERQLRPVLVAARSSDWTRNDEVFTQTLQEIDSGTRVMVHAISGAVSVHYLFLDRTVEWKLPDGRRKIGYCMKIIDSKAGRLCRDAEGPREDFHWVNEGWARFMVTEVHDNAIDVVYEHCAAYQSESETTELITHWARFILLWEGFLFPSNLVSSA
ncbi:hypothetical protein ON010_g4403 [Phytophthora cinnamomi]|nr:hypothetical protein ON010_g4403 [Phytophthora cinnamomi]